jgi:hypothetical protein
MMQELMTDNLSLIIVHIYRRINGEYSNDRISCQHEELPILTNGNPTFFNKTLIHVSRKEPQEMRVAENTYKP